jgi:hypothetical protein
LFDAHPSHKVSAAQPFQATRVRNCRMVDFEGTALQLPGVIFKAVLTRIGD